MPTRRGGVALLAVLAAVALVLALRAGPADDAAGPSPTPSPDVSAIATSAPPATPASPRPTRTPAAGSPTSVPSATAPGSAIVPGAVGRSSLALTATYDVDVALDYEDGVVAVESTMTVRNDSAGPIDRLELNTVAARLGQLQLVEATVDGRPTEVEVDDQTLVVPLGGTLPDGAGVSVRLAFRATLRTDVAGSNWLFTRANGIVNAYRWLPWISRRVAFDRPNHGDPFVTPVSPRVEVRLTTDRPMGVATTGERTASEGSTQTFVATNVRDFTLTASPAYRSTARTVGDTTIRAFAREDARARAMLATAGRALERYEELLGPYPYPTLNLAESAGGYGMEGPGIVWIPVGVDAANLAYLVHHEVAHQWFYALVGADQAAEPFTDEATADFLARHVLGSRRASRCEAARLDLSIYDYSTRCYYEIVYIQGGNFLDDTRRQMGNDRFWEALRAWLEEQRFAVAPTRSLLETLDEHTTLDLASRFRPRFPRLY